MTDEQRKALTLYLGECWHEYDIPCPEDSDPCLICGSRKENRDFDNDADMMVLFRKMVDYLKFGAFQNFAYKYFNVYPSYTFTEWLFYDAELFCLLVAQWLKEKK